MKHVSFFCPRFVLCAWRIIDSHFVPISILGRGNSRTTLGWNSFFERQSEFILCTGRLRNVPIPTLRIHCPGIDTDFTVRLSLAFYKPKILVRRFFFISWFTDPPTQIFTFKKKKIFLTFFIFSDVKNCQI